MAHDPFTGPGLSLAEALERPADIDAWCAKDRLEKALAAAGGPITPDEFPRRRDAPDEETYDQQWRAAERRRSLMADLDDAREQLHRELECSIRSTHVFAVARVPPDSPRRLLTHAECRKLRLFTLPPPPAWAPAEPPYVADLGFYGLLDLPDVATRLSGMRLADAFREAVLNWPELQHVIASSHLVGPVLDGQFTFGRHAWPVTIEDWCLADVWLVSQGYMREAGDWHYTKNGTYTLDDEAGGRLTVIGRYIGARVARFLELLRTGALVARDGAVTVPTWWWQRPSFRVHFPRSRLFEQIGEDLVERSGELIVTAGSPRLAASADAPPPSDSPRLSDKNPGANGQGAFHVKPTEPDRARSPAAERAAEQPTRKHSATHQNIAVAIRILWPDGIPKTLTAKARNWEIIDWLATNRKMNVSERSVYRYIQRDGAP
ncbi:hypothetical protein CCR97_09475 [Rhodoplanes elegans]|uniref:Uncharacterized protein n=1 Tax=Rhodoplanes elegans TaxID=29408 RepID=A0A327KRU7_9BRAD|nr:hypothetical protein [Rhodoplanes elegans]MBK5958437.1 hypothetical protein [Rhodoplanes elegans]RAI41141.1 hypothetical protein CH338_04040 [Rhodoplanes elegans]